jgi:hypothetical protein
MPSTTELLREAEFRKCASDPDYFFATFCVVRHPSRGRIPFQMREAQRETLKAFMERDRVIILKARQIGFSTLCAAYALWLVLFHEDVQVIFLSRTELEANELLAKARYAYKQLPQWLQERGPQPTSDNMQRLPFNNDSSIDSLASRSNPARGRSVSLVIVDECAFLENQEEAWAAIEPIADVGGKVILLSTANGVGNFFHRQWLGARQGTNGFTPIFYPWNAIPERDDAWFKDKVASLSSWQRAQEYPESEDEAFIKSGNPVFDVDALSKLPAIPPVATGELVHGDLQNRGRGPLDVWEIPNLRAKYVMAADVAEGLEYGDYSSAHVINIITGNVDAEWHGHTDADTFGDVLNALGRWYNTALLGVENNNHGLTTLTRLKQLKYPRLYYSKTFDQRTQTTTRKMGWSTTTKTKPLMVDGLHTALREKAVHVLGAETISELKTYIRDDRGRTNGQPFDDRVVSLAIAVQMMAFARAPEYDEVKSKKYTDDWWLNQGEKPQVGWRIGEFNQRRV